MNTGTPDDQEALLAIAGGGTFPCTLLQESLWARRTDRPQGLNIAMRWLIGGNLSHAAAQGALQSLVQRHEILRTSFREIDGKPVQIVHPSCPLKLRDIDLSFLSADQSAARAEEIARAEALEPIDPTHAPLLRATVLRFGPDRGVLMLTFHALVADGWTTGLVVSEFRAAAIAIESGAAPDTSEPELQFADYALWERESLASGGFDEARGFWRQQLRNAVGTQVPPDRPATTAHGQERSYITSLLLPNDLLQAVDGFARRHDATLYSLAAASLALLLRRVTGDREIVIGSQVANREDPASENLFGPTVNSITLRLPVDDKVQLGAFARTAADTVREALQHQRLPFEIAETFARRLDGRPLHAINLVVHRSYSGIADAERDNPGRFSLISLPSFSSGIQWPLNFYMIGRDEGWRLSCEAEGDLFDPQTVQGLLEGWRRCLEAFTTSADRSLADCPALQEISSRAAVRLAVPQTANGREPIPVHEPERQVVRFNEGGTRTPMVVLNNRSVYYQLARQVGPDRPFIDMLMYHQDAPRELGSYSFEDLGTYAVRLIQWAQPRGPYILGGHCVYGVLAFEAARQLQRMGEEVSLVTLFDSWGPGYRETMSPWNRFLRRQQLRLHRYGQRFRKFRRGEVGLDEMIRRPILFHLGLLPPEQGPTRQQLAGEWFDSFLYDKVAVYRPTPYDGNVVLFRTRDPLHGRLFDERMGWGPLVSGSLAKIDVNSGHFDMFREQPAATIASFLKPW